LFYIPAWENSSATYRRGELLEFKEGGGFMGQGPGRGAAEEDVFSSIVAMDPNTGARKWTFRLSAASTESGVLTTLDPEIEAKGWEKIRSTVEVDTTDGRTLVEHADERYRGGPDLPFTREDLFEKFSDCASLVLPADGVIRAFELIERLDTVGDIGELVAALTPPGA
jgi:hypothetical protein